MILLGSLVNGGAIVVGGLVGMFAGKLLPERLRTSVMAALSLMTIGIAVPGLLKSSNALIPIISMVIGTIIGELLNIDAAVNKLGENLQKRFSGSRVTEGFVTGSLVFAIGALAVMGPLQSGLQHQHDLLFSKSVIDGVASIVFASTLGLGVALSGLMVFAVEGSIALLASVVAPYLGEAVVNEITFVGSLLIVGISLNLLGITKLRILNMVPAILLPILLCRFM
jgi:uncharacterized membrane protein YqgA involved in biofilm formation